MTESDFADPSDLDTAGRSMWDELLPNVPTSDGKIILLEACRCKDRLDKFDSLLRGDVAVWSSIKLDANDEPVQLMIDKASAQATATQNMMKQLIAALRLPDAYGKPSHQRPRSQKGVYEKANVSSIERARSRAKRA